MDQHEETNPNAKVLLLAAGGAALAALLIAIGRRGSREEPREQAEAAAKEVEKKAKKAAKAARKQQKKLREEVETAQHHIVADLREAKDSVESTLEATERDLKAAAWDAQQEAKEAESRLRAARQRVVEDAGHLASRVGAEARHLAGGGKERLAHLRHREDGHSAAEREIARLRAELEELRAEHSGTVRRAEKDAKKRLRRIGGQSGAMQAVAADAGAAALAQVERALRAKAPALLTARSRAQVMEILQQDLGPTLRESAMQAAAAALASWDATRERSAASQGETRIAAEDIKDEAAGIAKTLIASASDARNEAIEAAEIAAREARDRAEEAAHRIQASSETGKSRFWRSGDVFHHLEDAVAEERIDVDQNNVELPTEPSEEARRGKAGLFWGGAGLGLALYAMLDAERREKVIHLANEASVQIQELVRDLQGYDDEF